MKTRKQGNVIVLTVPTKFGIEENVEYMAVKGSNESITFIKKKRNIFEEALENHQMIDADENLLDDEVVGREML